MGRRTPRSNRFCTHHGDLRSIRGHQPDIVRYGLGDLDDAFLTVTAATICHDFGNLIHRSAHEHWSVALARLVLDRLLSEIYPQRAVRIRIRSFILSAIDSHLGDPPAYAGGGPGLCG